MFIAEIAFSVPASCKASDAELSTHGLLAAWCKNGQMQDTYELYSASDGALRARVTLPEENALDNANANKWVEKALRELGSHGIDAPSVEVIGTAVDGWRACACKQSSAYILITNFLSIVSPVKCMDCYGAVPFYRLPPADKAEGHDNIRTWNEDYMACDMLQMNGQTGKRFAIREMSNVKSSLSQRGRALCEQIESSSDVPTYYYLYRPTGRSLAQERKRSCPSCDDPWLLPEQIPPIFDFRCESCRLASSIAFSL